MAEQTSSGGAGVSGTSSVGTGWLRGVVKHVPSGDRVVIMGVAKGGAIPPEKEIALAYVTAPRLARTRGDELKSGDEACAWDSREWLRKRCIGQVKSLRESTCIRKEKKKFSRETAQENVEKKKKSERKVKCMRDGLTSA